MSDYPKKLQDQITVPTNRDLSQKDLRILVQKVNDSLKTLTRTVARKQDASS